MLGCQQKCFLRAVTKIASALSHMLFFLATFPLLESWKKNKLTREALQKRKAQKGNPTFYVKTYLFPCPLPDI